jgi:thiamine biosynthesis lipoprotein
MPDRRWAGALAAMLSACRPLPSAVTPQPVTATVTGQAMGGAVRVTVRCPSVSSHAACMTEALHARGELERIAAIATDWTPTGEIAALNAAAGHHPVPVSADVHAMLETSQRVAEATDGAFDVTINALWGLWDFDAGHIPDDARIAERLPLIGSADLILDGGSAFLRRPGMSATLGGIAQGYAATAALRAIPEHPAAVDVSGDIAVRGAWTVGIQHPRRPRGELLATLVLTDAALTTSGDYERAFERDGVRYHHILDPRTGRPATGAMSATVVHPDGAIADALSTALVVRGADAEAVETLGAWALVVTSDGAVHELGPRTFVSEVQRSAEHPPTGK